MVYIYPNSFSTFVGDRDIALNAGYIEISNKNYEDLLKTKLMWQDGELISDPTYSERKAQQDAEEAEKQRQAPILEEINQLKNLLSASDYQAIKHSEGWISDEDYAEIKAQRQAWRNRINELEIQLENE